MTILVYIRDEDINDIILLNSALDFSNQAASTILAK